MGASLAAGSTHDPQRDVDATLGLGCCAGGEPCLVALVEMDTALHDAVEDDDMEAVRQLVEEGADVEAKDADGDRPLHLAAQNGHLEVVRVLVEAGADLEAQVAAGARPLHLAAEEKHGHVAKVLVEAGANVEAEGDDGWRPLHLAAHDGHSEVVRMLAEVGADLEAETALGRRQAAAHGSVRWVCGNTRGAAGAGGGHTSRGRIRTHPTALRDQLSGSAVAAGGRG